MNAAIPRLLPSGYGAWLMFLVLSLSLPFGDVREDAVAADGSQLDTKQLLEKYEGEERVCTQWQEAEQGCCKASHGNPLLIKYLSEDEQEAYKLEIVDGAAYLGGKKLPHLDADEDPETVREYIFSMDTEGQIYIKENSPLSACRFHHSSFVAGGPVAGAGHMKIRQGKIISVNNFSGHYHPPDKLLDQVLAVLKKNNVRGIETIEYFGKKPIHPYRH